MALVEVGEAHVVVDLDQAEHVIDVTQSVVTPSDEASGAIEVDQVEDCDEQPDLKSLGWVVYRDDWDHEEDQTSNEEVWEVEDVAVLPGQMNTFDEVSVLSFELWKVKFISAIPNEEVQTYDRDPQEGEDGYGLSFLTWFQILAISSHHH